MAQVSVNKGIALLVIVWIWSLKVSLLLMVSHNYSLTQHELNAQNVVSLAREYPKHSSYCVPRLDLIWVNPGHIRVGHPGQQ